MPVFKIFVITKETDKLPIVLMNSYSRYIPITLFPVPNICGEIRKNGFSSLKPGLKTPEESLSPPRQ